MSFSLCNVSCVFIPFELSPSNIWGSFHVSLFGIKYFVTFIYDRSYLTLLYLTKDQTKVFHLFSISYNEVLNQYEMSTICLLTVNACEYFSTS